MKSSFPLLWFGMAGCLGAWLGYQYPVAPWLYPAGFLFFAVGALVFKGRLGVIGLLLACLAAFMFHAAARGHYFPETHLLRTETGPRMAAYHVAALEDGTLTVNPRGVSRLEFTARVLELREGDESKPAAGKLRVLVREPGPLAVRYGEEWQLAGYLQPIRPPENPGEFDARSYHRNRGVFHDFLADATLTVKLNDGAGNPLKSLAFRLRRHMRETLRTGMEHSPETTALMTGMLFGDKGAIAEETGELFRVTGTQHIFAVSGLHVATVLAVLLVALDLAGVVRRRWAWLVLPALLVFCLATGMRPSAFRALVMITLVLGGWWWLRPVNVFNLLGAAALWLLAWEPGQILDTGFQLSFCVVLGMALGGGFLYRLLYAQLRPDPWIPRRCLSGPRLAADKGCRMVCAAAATAGTAWLASVPILAGEFHIISPVTPLANMVIVPLAGLAVTIAALSVILGWLWQIFPLLLNEVNWLVLKVMVWCAGFFAQLPGSHFYVGVNSVPADTARFTFFKQEQLAPALLQYRGRNWLIGTGSEALWRYNINPYRKSLGVNSFDGIVLPRAGVRASGAAAAISGEVPVGFWAESGLAGRASAQRQFIDKLEALGLAKQFWRAGDELPLAEGLRVNVLWPANDQAAGNQNDDGLVLRIVLPGGALLYAGNISRAVESSLLASGLDLSADCLVQGQNNNGQNLSRDWLLAVKPKWLIRPARGYFSDAALTREFWQTVQELDIEVWRMEDDGAAVFEISPQGGGLRKFGSMAGD
jgi:ComEC/Rec2-related protein